MIRLVAVILAVALLAAPAEARRRKRVNRPVYRKPPVVYVLPDVVQPLSYAEYWEIEEQRRREAVVRRLIAILSCRLF